MPMLGGKKRKIPQGEFFANSRGKEAVLVRNRRKM
jgi:hypothetical protein